MVLLALAVDGVVGLGARVGPAWWSLPVVAVLVDLAFQRARFEALRFPDAAVATALFVALLLPPDVSVAPAALLVAAAVALRHAIRYRGHPWWNPAAFAVLAGAAVFGYAPAWWIAVGPYGLPLLLAGGAIVLLRNRGRWRLPAAFFATVAALTVPVNLLAGASVAPSLVVLALLDPTLLFFGLLMVVEPQTGPASLRGQLAFGVSVGALAVLLPFGLPPTGMLVALVVGNLGYLLLRLRRAPRPVPAPGRRRVAPGRTAAPTRWGLPTRGAVVVAVGMAFLIAGAAIPAAPSGRISSGGSLPHGAPVSTALCATDNTSIAASTLSSLHSALGPSVILAYVPSNGEVVFYDPVHQVTVYETDLYEDYGSAEFNGDDYAVGGCAP